jgi:hypothetical protein
MEFYLFLIRSLTPQQAAGNALAFAVQGYPYLSVRHVCQAFFKSLRVKKRIRPTDAVGVFRSIT